MTKLKRLQAERAEVQHQVDLFERKYKNFDTIWHQTLERLDAEIAKIEVRRKKKSEQSDKGD